MKKILILILLITNQLVVSQTQTDLISLEFNNSNKEAVLKKIEETTKYKFFYQENWLEANVLISGNYKDKTLADILKLVFENSTINYFITKNSVILTKNIAIKATLVDNYFGEKKRDSIVKIKLNNPVFYKQFDSIKNNNLNKNEALTLVGKQTANENSDFFEISGYVKNSKNGESIADVVLNVKKSATNESRNSL